MTFDIPKEVLDQCGLSLQQLSMNPDLVDSGKTLQEWMSEEVKRCKKLIHLLEQEKLDIAGTLLVKALTGSLVKDVNKLD